MPTSDLLLDYNNMMSDVIGLGHGIEVSEIESLKDAALQIHKGLQQLKSLGQLPFCDLPYQVDSLRPLQFQAGQIREKFETVVVFGIGGSALGARCLFEGLLSPFYNLQSEKKRRGPQLFIVDNIDPSTMESLFESLRLNKTFFIVMSKSGGTTETLAQFFIAKKKMQSLRKTKWREHFCVVTDPEKGFLRQCAQDEGLPAFDIPPGVGGRYSVFTPVGLLPAACVGINIKDLLKGAARMEERCRSADLWTNPAALSAILHYLSATRHRKSIRVLMPYSDPLGRYADWFIQLWAESLGKKYSLKGDELYAGSTPLKAVGTTDQHAQLQMYLEGPDDKVINFITVDDFENRLSIPKNSQGPEKLLSEVFRSEQRATQYYLSKIGRPNMSYRLKKLSAHTLGQLLFLAQMETAFAGELWNVNPFDQPGVEKCKIYIQALLGKEGLESAADELKRFPYFPRYTL